MSFLDYFSVTLALILGINIPETNIPQIVPPVTPAKLKLRGKILPKYGIKNTKAILIIPITTAINLR